LSPDASSVREKGDGKEEWMRNERRIMEEWGGEEDG
jgi:hypothetical protein